MPQTLENQTKFDIRDTLFGAPGAAPAPTPPAPRNQSGRWLWLGGSLVLITGALLTWRYTAKPAAPSYGTARVARGSIAKTISATGRLQALTTVQVGTQASGTVSEIYVDYNSQVRKGQVIARLDPAQLQAQLTQAQASLTAAQASVSMSQATALSMQSSIDAAGANVARTQSAVTDAQQSFDRTKQLVAEQIAARQDLDKAQATLSAALAEKQQAVAQLNQAKAQAQSSQSQINQARAQSSQAAAAVQLAQVNLEHTVITAPIDGVIVARSVDVGQTVASSLQAPTLFQIANDLKQMQVLADIDEADVGQLKQGDRVTFSVDAYPNQNFEGRISQIRLAPQTVQNVVTYTAVIDVANPDLKLKPGMTANVTATVAEQPNVLKVPAAALRFRPDNAPAAAQTRRGTGTLYKVSGKQLTAVSVRTGLSDGVSTQIVSGDLSENEEVAVPSQPKTGARPAANNSRGGMFGMGAAPRGAGRVR